MKLLSLPSILGRSQRSLNSSKCSCIFLVQSHCLRANAIQSGGKLSKTLVEQENNSHACKLLTRTLTPTFSLLYILDLQRLGCTANDFRLQGKKYNSCDKQCYSCVLVTCLVRKVKCTWNSKILNRIQTAEGQKKQLYHSEKVCTTRLVKSTFC